MLDIKFIRENAEVVRVGARKKQMDPSIVDQVLEAFEKRWGLLQKVEELRARKNQLTKEDRVERLKRS